MEPYRVIISTSRLKIEVWTDLYRFIDSIYTNQSEDAKLDALHNLKEKSIEVWYALESNSDVYRLDRKELTDDMLKQLSKNTCYSIIYNKCDDLDDVFELAHFIKFTNRFTKKAESGNYLSLVSLIIYTGGMENQKKASSFRSKCNDFFALLFKGVQPVLSTKPLISIFDNIIEDKEDTSQENFETDNWLKRLNKDISFPKAWQEEKYVNDSENSPISSFNLMGVPQVNNCEESEHQKNLDRLFDIRNDLYKGHFEASNSHFRFFIDTESYARRESNNEKGEFMEWIHELQGAFHSSDESESNKLSILITPKAERELDFIHTINDKVFSGKALIVYLDINNKHASCVEKCSFLKYLNKDIVRYHYVDHILFTGETYQRTKSLLYSIIGDQDESTPNKEEIKHESQEHNNQKTEKKNNPIRNFDSIITVINHLSFTKDKEIKIDVKNNLFAFIDLYYPSSRFNSKDCQLCRLDNYYNELSKETVLDNCQTIIQNYLKKIKLKNIEEVLLSDKKELHTDETKRNFIRLVMTHELCYRLSQIAWGKSNFFDITRSEISEELDSIYNSLQGNHNYSGVHHTKSNINKRINNWFNPEFDDDSTGLRDFINMKLETDKKISFLKVISSPPLSQYIVIRDYAHSKLLCVLYEIINKKNENDYSYDDLKIVKSILKSLSFLKSNALVRKDVIVGIWQVLWKVIDNNCIRDEISRMKIHENFIQEKIKKIEKKTNKGHLSLKSKTQSDKLKDCLDYLESNRNLLEQLFIDEIIKDFSRDAQFFIKNVIVKDDAKATFLGELIRQGEEMRFDSNEIVISATKLISFKNSQAAITNNLFEYFSNNGEPRDSDFNKEYTKFLVWLFYDNTTIIRKTLDNFSKELNKDSKLFFSFKYRDKDKNQHLLKEIDFFKNSFIFNKTVERFNSKIDSEYYYSSFKPYLKNGDNINYVNKLIYVLYAKLKLEDLIINKHKTSIETDIKDLLTVFSEIMGADAAFLILKKDKKSYPISVYKKDDPDIEWNYEEWFLDSFYTRQILSLNNIIYPNVPLYNIQRYEKTSQPYGERDEDFEAHSLNIYVTEHSYFKTRATITFLYDKTNQLISNETRFRINVQESGRLLLLLKKEIDRYLIDYLITEKVFDIWLEKDQSYRKFEKIYSKSNHTFNAVFGEMDEFEEFDESIIRQSYRIWYFLTNQTINFFYSNIERNIFNGADPMHCLTIDDFFIKDDNNTLGNTFNEKFITILSSLLNNRWNCDGEKNTIRINNRKLQNFKLSKVLFNTKIPINKHLLRTIIVQCLHNSLSSSMHGHRTYGEVKRIDIKVSDSFISLEDHFIKNVYTQEEKAIIAQRFEKKKKYIRQLNCYDYSSTTLTTIQGVFNYMNDGITNGKFRCEYGFNENYDFTVTLFFNNK
jgi:hypothetical protein